MRRNLVLLAMLISWGCGGAEAAPSNVSSSASQGPSDVEMVAAMEQHYRSAILAHDSLIQGDLAAFRVRLAELDAHALPPNSPDAWKPFDAQLHAAAREAGQAADLPSAANAMASVVLACGACHQSSGGGPVYPVPPVGQQSQPLKAQMRAHQWATQMLWDGVTGPSDYAWERGSEELAETRIFAAGGGAGAEPDESLLGRESALRALGEEAKTTTGLPSRATLYGRLLATCGGCHQASDVELPAYKSSPPLP